MTTKRRKPTTGADRATNAKIELRVQAIVKLKRGCAGPAAICRFVAEREQAGEEPWKMGPGRNPLSERTIERYSARATQIIRADLRRQEKENSRLHRAKMKKRMAKVRVDFAKMRSPFQSGGMPK